MASHTELADQLANLRKGLRTALRGPEKARKALDAAVASGALERLATCVSALEALADLDLAPLGLEEGRIRSVAGLREHVTTLRREARQRLLGELRERGAADGLQIQTVAEQPVTLVISPVTVELDFATGTGRVLFAREEVLPLSELAAAAVLDARTKAMAAMTDRAVDSEAFFRRLRHAYRMVLVARGERPGTRVDLVDVLAPLALLELELGRWRSADPAKLARYPRHLLAYQLRRLRRDQALTVDGVRLELGVATGGTTKNKKDVLFVPTATAEGQYYLSLRFVSE